MSHSSVDSLTSQLFTLIRKYAKRNDLVLKKGYQETKTSTASRATREKPQLGLVGKKVVSVAGREPQQTYVAGVIQQKHFAGFYFMPMYSHPSEFSFSPDVKKMLKGKSCINVTTLNPDILKELDTLIKDGIALYKKEGWI